MHYYSINCTDKGIRKRKGELCSTLSSGEMMQHQVCYNRPIIKVVQYVTTNWTGYCFAIKNTIWNSFSPLFVILFHLKCSIIQVHLECKFVLPFYQLICKHGPKTKKKHKTASITKLLSTLILVLLLLFFKFKIHELTKLKDTPIFDPDNMENLLLGCTNVLSIE